MSEPTRAHPIACCCEQCIRSERVRVQHALNCACRDCIHARQAEVRRRIEDMRRDARREELARLEDAAGRGVVFGSPRKAQPGTALAIALRYAKGSR